MAYQVPFLNPLPVEVKLKAASYPIKFKPQAVTLVDVEFMRRIKKRAEKRGLIELSLDRLKNKSLVEPLVQESLKQYVLTKLNPAIRGWDARFAEQKQGNREPEITPEYLTLKKIRDYVLEIVQLNEAEKAEFEIKPAEYKGAMFKVLEEIEINGSTPEELNAIYSSMTQARDVIRKEEKKHSVGINFEKIAETAKASADAVKPQPK